MSDYHVQLQCKRLHPDAVLPAKASEEEAGWDMCCIADDLFDRVCGDDIKAHAAKVRYPCIHTSVMDMYYENAKIGDRFYVLYPGQSHKFRLGFACAIDPGYCMLLWDRSGMGANKNIHRLAGVIDCTYRGEWLVSLINLSEDTHVIHTGDKIIQGIITMVFPGQASWVEDLPDSVRGAAGFGSTGR